MKTTRDADLDILTDHIGQAPDSVHVKSVREQVYAQSKDSYLEKKRRELEYWIIEGLGAYQSGTDRKQKERMAQAEMNIERIEREIKLYSSSDDFQQTLAKAASRIANSEADLFVAKQKKGLL